jgi:TFIIF-interacting CTD phosphatase-like protein
MQTSSQKILLILDLDETLIHATEEKFSIKEDFTYTKYNVYLRPHFQWFMEEMYKHFTLEIWSSADDDYVRDLVEKIKPASVAFEFAWGKSRCTLKRDYELDKYVQTKQLKKLKKKGFSLDRMLIVDDSPEKVKDHYGNAIYMPPFEGDPADVELKRLAKFLINIKDVANVRSIEKRGWRDSIILE